MRRLPLALLLLVAGCAGLEQYAASALQRPKLTFRSASVQTVDLEGATVALTWDLENGNAFGVELARVSWTLDAEGTRVASGDLPGGLHVKAQATSPVTFPVRVRYRDVPGIVSLLGSGKDAVRYSVAATFGVRTPVGVLDLAVSHEDRVRLPSMPQFALEGVTIRSMGLDGVNMEVRLRVRNTNGFALPEGSLDYALAIGGAEVARARGATMAPVAGGTSAVVLVPVRVDLASAGRVATELGRGGDVAVGLSGSASVGGIPFPLRLEGKVPVHR